MKEYHKRRSEHAIDGRISQYGNISERVLHDFLKLASPLCSACCVVGMAGMKETRG